MLSISSYNAYLGVGGGRYGVFLVLPKMYGLNFSNKKGEVVNMEGNHCFRKGEV